LIFSGLWANEVVQAVRFVRDSGLGRRQEHFGVLVDSTCKASSTSMENFGVLVESMVESLSLSHRF
jgi:hypothetical protein